MRGWRAERQALLGALRGEVHVATHPPQEFVAPLEEGVFLRREQARADEFALVAHPVGNFAIQNRVLRSRIPPFPSLTLGSTR